jgi:hypothetical protein
MDSEGYYLLIANNLRICLELPEHTASKAHNSDLFIRRIDLSDHPHNKQQQTMTTIYSAKSTDADEFNEFMCVYFTFLHLVSYLTCHKQKTTLRTTHRFNRVNR